MHFLVLFCQILCGVSISVKGVKINLVTVIIGDNPIYGFFAQMPAYDVAYLRLEESYPEVFSSISRYSIYEPGMHICDNAAGLMYSVAGKLGQLLQSLEGFSIVISPGCSFEVIALGDFAREWNVPLLATIAGDKSLTNKDRYPTVIAYGPPDHPSLALAGKRLLDKFGWRTVTFFCDKLSQYPGLNGFYQVACRNFQQLLGVDKYTLSVTEFDSKKDPLTTSLYKNMLRETKGLSRDGRGTLVENSDRAPENLPLPENRGPQSARKAHDAVPAHTRATPRDGHSTAACGVGPQRRMVSPIQSSWITWTVVVLVVVMIFTRPSVLREIMVLAQEEEMTQGNYIFIAPVVTQVPTLGNITWQYNDASDMAALEAYRSVILLSNSNADWDNIADLVDEIINRTATQYHHRLSADEKRNDLTVAAYEVVTSLAQVLNESYDSLHLLDGRKFCQLFWNRTFDLKSRNFFINAKGMRTSDVIFTRLNVSTGAFMPAWRYYSPRYKFAAVSALADTWRNPRGPPENSPLCGFRSELCWKNDLLNTIIIAVPTCLGLICLICLIFGGYWHYLNSKDRYSLWWYLGELTMVDASSQVRVPHAVNREGDSTLAKPKPDVLQKKVRLYGDTIVWLEDMGHDSSASSLLSSKKIKKIMAEVKGSTHDNVGKLFGICITSAELCLVWEFGVRGNLRKLLDSHIFSLDIALQVSIMWDILRGIQYIHASALRYHGCTSSISAVIDKRFTVKLCGAGSTRLVNVLHKRSLYEKDSLLQFWMSPEMLKNPKLTGSRESDVYSMAVVLFEVLSLQSPLDVHLESEKSVLDGLSRLQENPGIKRVHIDLITGVPKKLRNMLEECFEEIPKDRPGLRRLITLTAEYYPSVNILSSMLQRLQKYSEDLEVMVYNRSQELLDERRKVDALLKELIPGSLVTRLRNKENIPPEAFDSISISFSDIPQFEAISMQCSPLQIVRFLHEIYTAFDMVVAKYEVYKVETICDSYMVAAGLPVKNENGHAVELGKMALGLMSAAVKVLSPADHCGLLLRVGIHSGPCVAGIVGLRQPRYCLFGDTVNTASRMESHGEASKIHISWATKDHLGDYFDVIDRGPISIKGKGDVLTYWLAGKKENMKK